MKLLNVVTKIDRRFFNKRNLMSKLYLKTYRILYKYRIEYLKFFGFSWSRYSGFELQILYIGPVCYNSISLLRIGFSYKGWIFIESLGFSKTINFR